MSDTEKHRQQYQLEKRFSRELALCLLYQMDEKSEWEIKEEDNAALWALAAEIEGFELSPGLVGRKQVRRNAVKLAAKVLENRAGIDAQIAAIAENWSLNRMACVDRNILRLGAAELLHAPAVPAAVAINEAVELAKAYGGDDSGRFINGILDKLAKTCRA